MRANKNVMIVDDKPGGVVVLVPYREEHVKKYHEWMSDPELRELTASEPLTLEEEYAMQSKWQEDEDKLTFIVCVRPSGLPSPEITSSKLTMIGDVNMFLKGTPDDPEFEAEVEIMIAEPAFRRKGVALTALHLFLSYASSPSLSPALGSLSPRIPVPRDRLVARIGETNEPSVRLFAKLGFAITKRVPVFEEIEMRYVATSDAEGASGMPWRTGDVRDLTV